MHVELREREFDSVFGQDTVDFFVYVVEHAPIFVGAHPHTHGYVHAAVGQRAEHHGRSEFDEAVSLCRVPGWYALWPVVLSWRSRNGTGCARIPFSFPGWLLLAWRLQLCLRLIRRRCSLRCCMTNRWALRCDGMCRGKMSRQWSRHQAHRGLWQGYQVWFPVLLQSRCRRPRQCPIARGGGAAGSSC